MQRGRSAFSCIYPNAPTHGPPTSSAVLVNLGNLSLITKSALLTKSGAPLSPALSAHVVPQPRGFVNL